MIFQYTGKGHNIQEYRKYPPAAAKNASIIEAFMTVTGIFPLTRNAGKAVSDHLLFICNLEGDHCLRCRKMYWACALRISGIRLRLTGT